MPSSSRTRTVPTPMMLPSAPRTRTALGLSRPTPRLSPSRKTALGSSPVWRVAAAPPQTAAQAPSVISRKPTRPMRSRLPITVSTGRTQRSSRPLPSTSPRSRHMPRRTKTSSPALSTRRRSSPLRRSPVPSTWTTPSTPTTLSTACPARPRTSWSSRSCSRAASRTLPMRLPFPSSRANAIRTTRGRP